MLISGLRKTAQRRTAAVWPQECVVLWSVECVVLWSVECAVWWRERRRRYQPRRLGVRNVCVTVGELAERAQAESRASL